MDAESVKLLSVVRDEVKRKLLHGKRFRVEAKTHLFKSDNKE